MGSFFTKILEVNLFAFAPIDWGEIFMKQSVGKCEQIITSRIFV